MIDLNLYRKNLYTNSGVRPCPGYGEDGVILKIFEVIGVSDFPMCVEFGELRVLGSTTRSYRIENFANAIYFSSSMDLRSWILNCLDILKLFKNTGDKRVFKFFRSLPKRKEINPSNVVKSLSINEGSLIDLIVVDIDSFDYDVVSEILKSGIIPRVFIVEYNPNLPHYENLYVKYGQEEGLSANKKFYGASYQAWLNLFTLFDYRLVHISGFCNLIFVHNDVDGDFALPNILEEITDTDEKVLSFATNFCLPGFVPSWLISPKLSSSELALLRH
jgi:hypothetical protein